MLTEKERLHRALKKETVDRPPCICPGGMMNMITTDLMDICDVTWPEAHTDARMMASLALASYEHGCFENVGVPFCMTIEAEAMGAEVTMGTRNYEPHVTGYAADSVKDWRKLSRANMNEGRTKVVLDAIRILKAQNLNVPIIGNLVGPISTASSVIDPVPFYKELRKEKAESHAFLTFVTEQLIEFANAMVEAGADVIAISDPSGTGEILGPKFFEEYAVKYLNMLLDGIKDKHAGTIVHICGQMRSVYKQVDMLHADALSFDAVVPMREARKNLGDRVLMGNVSTFALEFGDEERIEKLTKACVDGGSNIVSPACGLGTKTPIANIRAILNTLKSKRADQNKTATIYDEPEGEGEFTITVRPSGKVYKYEAGSTLLELLLARKIFVDNPCNGKGVCGKCRVRVLKGNLPAPSETERRLLKKEEIDAGVRLSCLVRPECNLEIELMQKERKHEVLTSGYIPKFKFNPDIRKQTVEICKPSLMNQTPYEDQIVEQIGCEVNFESLKNCDFIPGEATVVLNGNDVIQIEQGNTTNTMFGVAIDIGTTTVVCTLVNMITGKEIAHSSMINAQKHFGLDVLTRITYELEHPDTGIKQLQTAIVDSINDMIGDICRQAGIQKEDIYEVAIAANCTMMHMLLGVNAVPLGKSPYAPIFVRSKNIKASSIGIHVAEGGRVYCLPSVSAYIGADIVAGAYVCKLKEETGNVLFIDIGTNGEIVLSNKGKLLCCSCAAGPALEGMNISSGMRAAEGAIEDVEITAGGIKLKVIGDDEPIGICGSGILAVVKELLRVGLVRKDGAFIKMQNLDRYDYRYKMLQENGMKREFIMTDKPEQLLITQADVRQVQLAKGAILSGFIALLKKAGIRMDDLDKVMIAGQFGAHLPADSLIGTGILPKEIKDKLVYVGNSSKTGAYMALMSSDVKREMEELANYMDYMELGATDGYERLFSECLLFPEYN